MSAPVPAATAKKGRAAGTPRQPSRKKFELSRRARKLTLAIHVVTSVGWVGLSLSMAVLAIMGYTTDDAAVAKGVYYAMYVFDDTSVTVFSITAAITGILLSCGTKWGLLLHWWIVVKWVITLFMTIFAWFVIHPIVMTATERTADVGDGPPDPGWAADFLLWSVPVLFALLTVAAVVSVYKPWGRTARGRRAQPGRR
ncbi:hypothetical protein [Streptomyces afghaniensis]|uniref:hypothetical protein n=1 Tax=Streptomyces afghaniensis TaxID=66865 RepID=UPI002784243C|nr:hypothetical protein [Streptomyces afghaniensis]MDQ1016524.1 putative membrane protein [Streptomyces afghaniensis]